MVAARTARFVARVHFAGRWLDTTPLVWPTVIHAVEPAGACMGETPVPYAIARRGVEELFRGSMRIGGFGVEVPVLFDSIDDVEALREKCRPWDQETVAHFARG